MAELCRLVRRNTGVKIQGQCVYFSDANNKELIQRLEIYKDEVEKEPVIMLDQGEWKHYESAALAQIDRLCIIIAADKYEREVSPHNKMINLFDVLRKKT